MKLKNSYFYTLRENPKDEESVSGNLLTRAGMIKKTSSGIYMYLPLGYKVIKNIEKIIREEMENVSCGELLMPALISEDIYEKSGRKDAFGKDMFCLNDRFNKPYILGPTHEELFTQAAASKVRSYKDLPFRIYISNISIDTAIKGIIIQFIWIIIIGILGYVLSKSALKKAVVQGG